MPQLMVFETLMCMARVDERTGYGKLKRGRGICEGFDWPGGGTTDRRRTATYVAPVAVVAIVCVWW